MIRATLHGAAQAARDIAGKTAARMGQELGTLTEDEAVARYMLMHRGNPRAIVEHAARNAPPGTNPITAGHEYETKLEQLTRQRERRRARNRQEAI